VDVRDNSSSSNGSLDKGIKLLVSTNGELQVTRCDALDLKILASVAGQLEDLGGEVLQDGGGVDGGGGSDTLTLLDRLLQETVDTSYGKLFAVMEVVWL